MEERLIEYLPKSFFDPYLFCQGKCFKNYKFLGAKFITNNGVEGVSFTVFAPNAKRVNVVGNFNNWNGNNYGMNKVEDLGIWNIFISGIKEKEVYKYEIHTRDNNIILKSDPYAYYSELRPNTASKIVSLDNYKWNDKEWMIERKSKEKYKQPLNIYELHLGSWRKKNNDNFYNYREIADKIIEYVKLVGYTHIELLPVMEHPFDGSWGYQITGYYSITSRYGKPDDFMYFIDKCHQSGIGVILDWVPGHFCKDEHGLYKFDGTSIYEYDNNLMAENLEWGTAVFDHGKSEVVNFLISNAMFWLDIYHIDGLRVDAVSYMLYLDSGKKENQWIPNVYGGRENINAIKFLRKLNKTIHTYFPEALVIAEESTAWPFVTSPIEIGGLGFDFKWNMGWMNDMLKYMEMDPIHRKWHHNLITFSFTYAFSERYILPISHDEVVHGKKSLIEKMPGDYWQKFANLRLFYCYMAAHPGKKLLFMGSEFAQFIEWDFNKELDWFLFKYESHDKLNFFIKELNKLYAKERSLYEFDSDIKGFSWIDHQNYEQSVIVFKRNCSDESDFIIAVFNFTPVPRFNYRIGVPKLGHYNEIFNSDLDIFGGSGMENMKTIKSEDTKWHNQPYSINIDIPALGALFIKFKK